ncbi:Hypothetical protein SRAE_X000117600 [Strongyloides ratti]|uniref:DUF148 domain-containing protein n=1 Tax=Strongyloides ratti TaxID=34506 RepID=A0A090KPA2_STRRB|nr:Hypothetical protein SRAE_X000117600 [Strongyloides ratti]CEF59428.1 Hypothetical protein SRAE_X000117600 [Strongyloides ratti]
MLFNIISFIFGQYLFISQKPRYASGGLRMRNDIMNQPLYYSPSPMPYIMGRKINNPSYDQINSNIQNNMSPDFLLSSQNSQQLLPMANDGFQQNFYQNPSSPQFDSSSYANNMYLSNMISEENQKNTQTNNMLTQNSNNPMLIDKNEKLDINFPKFLDNVDQEVVNDFLRIISLKNETYSRKQQKLDQLVSTLDESHQKLYKDYVLSKDSEEKNYRSKVDSQVETMSPEAQQKFSQISSILMNVQIPDNNKWDRVMEIYNSLSDQLKQEFEKKFEGFKV